MINKEFDVFLAYHSSYVKNGPRAVADIIYEYFTDKGLKVFYFPKSGRDSYKANILDVMKAKTLLLICNEAINKYENNKLDQSKHYELSTEIDAFYALTQSGEDVTVQDSKIIVSGDYLGKEGLESKLHELFANRTHFFFDENKREQSIEEIFKWVNDRLSARKDKDTWQDSQVTSEVKEVFARRSSMGQKCNLPQMIATAKSIRCIGISNSELTVKMDIEAIKCAINNGAKLELVFLDPECEFTKQREKEEGLRSDRIKNITNQNIESALDLKDELAESNKEQYKLYNYCAQPRMNIIIIDTFVILQYYANNVAGMSNPCFLLEKQNGESPLYDFCVATFDELVKNAKEI